MANPFPSTEPAWGLRAYLILIGCAADRQTVTYDALARRIKRGGTDPLANHRPWLLDGASITAYRRLLPRLLSRRLCCPLRLSMLLAETRFLASKNGFGHLTGMEFFRRQLKNSQKTERATNVCMEVEYLSNFTSRILEGKNTSLSIEERSNK